MAPKLPTLAADDESESVADEMLDIDDETECLSCIGLRCWLAASVSFGRKPAAGLGGRGGHCSALASDNCRPAVAIAGDEPHDEPCRPALGTTAAAARNLWLMENDA